MNGARDFAFRDVRAALGLERVGVAVLLAREVDYRVFFCRPVAWLGESAVVLPQLFATGANIKVVLWIECEVASGEGPSEGIAGLSAAMRGLIPARTAVMIAVAAIDADMRRKTRASAACRRLMTIPGVGQLTALAFVAAIDGPSRIR